MWLLFRVCCLFPLSLCTREANLTYLNILLFLSFPFPFFGVGMIGADRGITSNVLEEVRKILLESAPAPNGRKDKTSKTQMRTPVLVSTLVSSDCSNLTNAMKALISGFIRSTDIDVGGE